MAFLELSDVCKGYGDDGGAVLRDACLEVERGELVAVVGPSGAGKTTLLSIIAGLTQASRGTVRLDGKVVTRPGPERAVVFQNYSLLPWLSVLDNVQLAVDQVHPEWSRARRREAAEAQVALVGLAAAGAKKPHELSGGMRQRVAVARALAAEPELLLMDEPLGALDALTRGTLQDEIESIWTRSGTTALLVTNDVDEAIRLADRIVPLGRGPGATLGASIPVALARPRDPRALERDHRYHELRARVYSRLRSGARLRPAAPGSDRAPAPVVMEFAA